MVRVDARDVLTNTMKQSKALTILQSGKNVFLTGEPGAGKTYTINTFTDWLDESGICYAVTASTGIAASHINGSTIHSWSGIGIMKNLEEIDINSIKYNKYAQKRILPAEVLILDEVSMLDSVFIDDLDKVLKELHRNEEPFGGIQVVMVGDFFQLPPVSRDSDVKFAFESKAWQEADFNICYLTEQHRQADPIFTAMLRSMRFDTMTEDQKNIIRSRISNGSAPTSLFTHNRDVDYMNTEKLKTLPGKEKKFHMRSEGDERSIAILKKHCLSPETLILKKDAVVMFTANKPDKGYVNGSIGTVVGFDEDEGTPRIQLMDGSICYPEMNKWKALDEKKHEKAYIMQLPLRLAWAITVHKSQGMSLDAASIDLSNAFEYGHGYVAVSRVRSLEGLHLIGVHKNAFKVNPKVLEQDKLFRESGVE